jgi:antitoxin component YwqK of YwqJK toxin-antitoxin module
MNDRSPPVAAFRTTIQDRRMAELNIAEIPYDDGTIRFRYARKLSPDGTRWLRHGLFQAFHPGGQLASDGHYHEGAEQGLWRDFHVNGQLAAEGQYEGGVEAGEWKYWTADGKPEQH